MRFGKWLEVKCNLSQNENLTTNVGNEITKSSSCWSIRFVEHRFVFPSGRRTGPLYWCLQALKIPNSRSRRKKNKASTSCSRRFRKSISIWGIHKEGALSHLKSKSSAIFVYLNSIELFWIGLLKPA